MDGYIHINERSRASLFRRLGEATSILLSTERRRVGIASIGAFVLPYAKLSQMQIFYGQNGYPGAYLTWAYLTDEGLDALRRQPDAVIDEEHLNAGGNLVVMDIISVLRDNRPIRDYIRKISNGRRFYGLRPAKSGLKSEVRIYKI